ncbi:MAG: hypothetical protein HYZ47_03915 [Simkania negevensis]|nr:hypothetical protein [Simkania negevensis]
MVSGVSSSSAAAYFEQSTQDMTTQQLNTQMEMNSAAQAGSQMNQETQQTQQETEELMQDAWGDVPTQM